MNIRLDCAAMRKLGKACRSFLRQLSPGIVTNKILLVIAPASRAESAFRIRRRRVMLGRVSTPVRGGAQAIVGRRRELDSLRAWLEGARDGAGRLVLCVGEPGIGKTRLAQELAGSALAGGSAVAWGRCVETEGAPAYWPWRQVLRSLKLDPDTLLSGEAEDRFRLFDDVTQAIHKAADGSGLVVIFDDIHWGDEPSLLLLRHLADQLTGHRLLILATFRSVEPASRLLPELLRSASVERLDLRGLDRAEVREQLSTATTDEAAARTVHEITGGNPLFVREIARAMADGSWRPDRPPRTVLEIVGARLDRVSTGCRRLVQAAAIIGRDFQLRLVAATLDESVALCLPLVDEAIAFGFLDRIGETGEHRFVHALTRHAVEASLTTADRAALHRAVAEALETQFAGDLSDHLADIARHRAELAPYGEGAAARHWMILAAEDAVRRLAYEEGVRLYRAALALEAMPLPDVERCKVQIALGRAAYLGGDLPGCVAAAVAAADAARAARSPELMGEAALVLEAVPDPGINATAKRLCEEALAGTGDEALRARLLAQRSHLAFYDGEQDRIDSLSAEALGLARTSHDDRALADALRARQEACPGPGGRAERLLLATEMLALAQRTNSARAAMWGELWRLEALIESGQLAAAAEELPALRVAVEQVGGPVSAWHHDRVAACIAQARGRYAEAAAVGRRGFDRMRVVERAPASGAYFALQVALAGHIGVTEDAAVFAQQVFESVPRFVTISRLHRAHLLLCAGFPDEAAASYQQAGPLDTWSLPAFFVLPGYAYAALACADLGRTTTSPYYWTASNRSAGSTRSATVSPTWARSS
jgi:hypothetical protein